MLDNHRVLVEQFSFNGGSVVATSSSTQEDHHDQDKPRAAPGPGGRSRYFITLAPISSSDEEDTDDEDMDRSSVYDSIHNRETGEKMPIHSD